MGSINHIYVTVNEDMQKERGHIGTLADLACEVLNDKLSQVGRPHRVISINENFWTDHMRPREDNSSTWYDRLTCRLSVFYEFI